MTKNKALRDAIPISWPTPSPSFYGGVRHELGAKVACFFEVEKEMEEKLAFFVKKWEKVLENKKGKDGKRGCVSRHFCFRRA